MFYNNFWQKKEIKRTLLVWQDNFFCRFCMLQLALVKSSHIMNCLLLSDYYHKSKIKSVFSILLQLTMWHCPHLLMHATFCCVAAAECQAAIDRYLLLVRLTAANSQRWSAVGTWDRQPYHYLDLLHILYRQCQQFWVTSKDHNVTRQWQQITNRHCASFNCLCCCSYWQWLQQFYSATASKFQRWRVINEAC